jgi:hypothetical protein
MKVLVSEAPEVAAEAMRAHIRFSKDNALRRLELYFRLQKEYPQKYSRTTKKSLSLESFLYAESAANFESRPLSAEFPDAFARSARPYLVSARPDKSLIRGWLTAQ